MRRVLVALVVPTALTLAGVLGPQRPAAVAQAIPGVPTLSIIMRYAEAVPLPSSIPAPSPVSTPTPGGAAPTSEEIFIYVEVLYTGTEVLHFNPSDIRLIDDGNAAHRSQSYVGSNALKSADWAGSGRAKGWLLFTMPTGSKNLTLADWWTQQVPQGPSTTLLLGRTRPFTPTSSPRRLYAVDAQAALDAYLLDEALAAGYIRENIAPLFAEGGSARIPAAVRRRVQGLRATLAGDRKNVDAVKAVAAAQSLKMDADAIFDAIDHDLSAVLAVHSAAEWNAWSIQFGVDDRALADFYQNWPGLQ